LGINHTVLFAISLIRRVYSEFRRTLARIRVLTLCSSSGFPTPLCGNKKRQYTI
jgi:hypothetical protein